VGREFRIKIGGVLLIALKEAYEDENKLTEEFCTSSNCFACIGSDDTGEPNGYGCPAMEKFVEENYHLIK
jgi:hypothetical protein